MDTGKRFKELLYEKGLSQTKFKELSGISYTVINKIANNKDYDIKSLLRVIDYFKLPKDYFDVDYHNLDSLQKQIDKLIIENTEKDEMIKTLKLSLDRILEYEKKNSDGAAD